MHATSPSARSTLTYSSLFQITALGINLGIECNASATRDNLLRTEFKKSNKVVNEVKAAIVKLTEQLRENKATMQNMRSSEVHRLTPFKAS